MSLSSLSAPASSQAHQGAPARKSVRFGENPAEPAKKATVEDAQDKVEIGQSQDAAPADSVKNEEAEPKADQQPKKELPKPHFFKVLEHRIGQFFRYIGKAFQKLFGIEKPKTPLEQELKQIKRSMKPDNVHALLKAQAKHIQENGSQEEKEFAAPLLDAAKTDEGLRKFADENIQQPAALTFHLLNNPEKLQETLAVLAEAAGELQSESQDSKGTQTEDESKEKSAESK